MTMGGVGEVQLLAARPVPSTTQRSSQSIAEANRHDRVEQRVDSRVQIVAGSCDSRCC